MPIGKKVGRQRLLADLWHLIDQDWRNIEAGIYLAPEDWQGSPLAGLRRAVDFFADLVAVEARRHGGPAEALLPEAERYPAYYRRKFHFQSDGYLSAASAERYDHQVEVLFGGGAAAMRRQALVPLRRALEGAAGSAKLLDIGCGTGALLRRSSAIIRASPSPGSTCRRPIWRWRGAASCPGRASRSLRRRPRRCRSRRGVRHRHFSLSVSRAAGAGAPRRRWRDPAGVEAGGMLIFVDSLQTGDEPDYDALLDYFPFAFHEPYYASYLAEDLDPLMRPALPLRALARLLLEGGHLPTWRSTPDQPLDVDNGWRRPTRVIPYIVGLGIQPQYAGESNGWVGRWSRARKPAHLRKSSLPGHRNVSNA